MLGPSIFDKVDEISPSHFFSLAIQQKVVTSPINVSFVSNKK